MKVSRFLIVLVFVSACGSNARDDRTAAPEPAEPVAAPEGTTGEEGREVTARIVGAPESGSSAVARPARKAGESAAVKDERAAATGPVTLAAAEDGVNTDAAIMQDFNARVAAYMKIHKAAAKGDAKPRETERPGEISETQDALATRIRAARAAANHGDIFTAEIRHKFRRLLAPGFTGEDGRDAREILTDDAPAPGSVPFTVNAKYPAGQPLPSLPANVLLNTPTLPDPLEYRIIGTHLILLDTSAGLIVDYIPNAIR